MTMIPYYLLTVYISLVGSCKMADPLQISPSGFELLTELFGKKLKLENQLWFHVKLMAMLDFNSVAS